MSGSPKRRSPGRPAGGSDEILRVVFDTTLRELAQKGYERLSVEAIAASAGMNKTSLYRRWPTKAELVLAAIDASRERARPFRETHDLRADLVAFVWAKVKNLSTPASRALSHALMSIESDEALAASIRSRRYNLPVSVVEHAIARGDIPAKTDAVFVSEMLLAPVLQRLLVTHEPVDRAFVERVVDQVLAGLGQGSRKKQR
jgi:AcrR family transcriptional regulator